MRKSQNSESFARTSNDTENISLNSNGEFGIYAAISVFFSVIFRSFSPVLEEKREK